MKRTTVSTAIVVVACACATSLTAAARDSNDAWSTNLRREPMPKEEYQRLLKIDFFDPDVDVCKNGDTGTSADFGPCDKSKFPACEDGKELICYNRTNRRDKFYPDKQPYFFIDYKRVLCYPADWQGMGGCSSCTPGRWCPSEGRCILDERRYKCADWTSDGENDLND